MGTINEDVRDAMRYGHLLPWKLEEHEAERGEVKRAGHGPQEELLNLLRAAPSLGHIQYAWLSG